MTECYCHHHDHEHWCDFAHCEHDGCTCDKFYEVEPYEVYGGNDDWWTE